MMPSRLADLLALTVVAIVLSVATIAPAGPPRPATDEQIGALIAGAEDNADFGDADYALLLDEADVFVRTTGLATTQVCQLIKVLTPAGVGEQSVQRFDYDPATRRVRLQRLRVHRADGGVDEVPLDALPVQPTVQRWIFWGGEQIVVGVPHLQVGDVIEMRLSKVGFNIAYLDDAEAASAGDAENLQPPMPGHWYEVTLFAGHYPIVRKRYSVHMPSAMAVQYEVYNGPLKTSQWLDGDRTIYTFTAEDVPAIESEPHMVALDDCAPKVVMATLPTWEEKSRWFHDVNEPQFDADDAIRAKVAKITAGLTDLDEKIAACNHWVADNIRYYGTSRGPCEGFTLHQGIETFRDRGGVCKDKAGMLVTMLRVLGVEAYPALTMAGSRVEDIPADQFNHTVTVMRETDGGWRILDPTWIPLSREMWSSREARQGLVYGTPEGEKLTLSPYYPPEYNLLAGQAESRIDDSGGLDTRISLNLSGYPDTYLRRYVERDRRPDIKRLFEDKLNIAPNARLEELEFTDPYDYSHDAVVRMHAVAPGYAANGGKLRAFRLPLMQHPLADWLISDVFYDLSAEERTYGMHLRATRRIRYEEHVRLPDGWEAMKLPDAQSIISPAADLTFEAAAEEGGLRYTMQLDLKKHLVPPEDYVKYRETIEALKAISDDWVVCRRTGDENAEAKQAAVGGPDKEVRHE